MIRALMFIIVAGPAMASDRFFPPVGCTEVLTVQSRGCEVSHIYTCETDAPGDSWSVTFQIDGPVFLGKIDAETQWLESYDLFPMRREVLVQPSADPASLSELLDTGADSFDFSQEGPDGITRVVGYDRLTGETVVIDGETLLRTEFSARYEDETGPYLSITGNEFVFEKHRRFLAGTYTLDDGEDVLEWDNSPVDFIYPGTPGFFSKTPLYECEASLARFVPEPKGTDQ